MAAQPRKQSSSRGVETATVSAAADARAGGSLTDQQQLLRSQALSARIDLALKGLTGLAAIAVVVLLVVVVSSAISSRAVVVQVFDAPPALAQVGLSGKVVASSVQDALAEIQAEIRAVRADDRAINNAWTQEIEVQIPQTGISIGEVDRLLRTRLGQEIQVSGALVTDDLGNLSLTIRADGIPPRTFHGPTGSLRGLTVQAAEYVYGRFEPVLYASYLLGQDRHTDAIHFVHEAYPLATEDDQRAQLANVWGTALANQNLPVEAADKYRFVLEGNPHAWGVWDNLIGTLYDAPAGEQGAWLEGQRQITVMQRAGGAAPVAGLGVNYRALVQDWTGIVEWMRADDEGMRNLIDDTAPALAEAEGRRHDWRAVAKYLASAPLGADALASRQVTTGYREIEAGNAGNAINSLRPFVDAWRDQNTGVRYNYPDRPCYLGLAYGMAGDYRAANAVFDEMGRWIACYSFRADVLEMQGNREAADQAYARAIALGPSLPFAYHRRGLALLERGEFAMAAGRFRNAHQRGPTWADPLKGWGDALAGQGLWVRAVEKYRQAELLAPNWAELHLAHAVALEELGRREDARKLREKAAS